MQPLHTLHLLLTCFLQRRCGTRSVRTFTAYAQPGVATDTCNLMTMLMIRRENLPGMRGEGVQFLSTSDHFLGTVEHADR
jgi:hypothetical protein